MNPSLESSNPDENNTSQNVGSSHDSNKVEVEMMVTCPIISEHRMPASSLERHLTKCEKKNTFHPHPIPAVLAVKTKPLSFKELVAIAAGTENKQRDVSSKTQPLDTSKDLAILLAAERDKKRRRVGAKRIHTKNKSYNEILREVLAGMMESVGISERSSTLVKNVFQNLDHKEENVYAGVGPQLYDGNPYKRWQIIEEEEEMFLRKQREKGRLVDDYGGPSHSRGEERFQRDGNDQGKNRCEKHNYKHHMDDCDHDRKRSSPPRWKSSEKHSKRKVEDKDEKKKSHKKRKKHIKYRKDESSSSD